MISISQEKYADLFKNSGAEYILNLIDVACLQLNTDHVVLYANKKAGLLFQLNVTGIIGVNAWELFDKNNSQEACQAIQKAVFENEASITEYFCRRNQNWVSLHAIPSENGVVLMFTEITEITNAKFQLLEEQRRLKLAQELANVGYFEGAIGLESLYLSDELYRIYGYSPQEKPFSFELLFSYFHPEDQALARRTFEHQLREKCAFEDSYRIVTAQQDIKIVKLRMEFAWDEITGLTRFYGVIQDVTIHHHTKVELKESKELIAFVFNASLVGVSLLKPIRNPSGEIIDFRVEMTSREFEKEAGRGDLVGKLFLAEFPGLKASGLFDLMLNVMETSVSQQMEVHYHYDGYNGWFSNMFVKMEDALMLTTMNISNRKFAEQEQLKNLMILQQSEELAKIGSWEYDLTSESFSWSEGMYRLFNLPKEVLPEPEIYLQFATARCVPIAEKIVKFLKTGEKGFEETMEILVDEKLKVLKLRASIHRDENGKALKVLGVDIDMTLQVALFRKNELLKMEIFKTVLETQQAERKRIAENLHNGLGQLLYGVKLNLSKNMLNQAKLSAAENLKELQETDGLLADAIRESRRLSHELMPAILEDFGLRAALDDICNQFQLAILIRSIYTGLENQRDKSIEVAIYRVVQELIINVVKHAEANTVILTINANEEVIHIQVHDDGKGFDQDQVLNNGIGLKAIRNKTNLLNGSLAINSEIGKGTVISVIIPNLPSLIQ
ncbi:PAS domain-containing sensor histidine kinase [Pedobacter gandavensis]|uniref:Oxygen sensor histidine kinase NreB n=1 Tax=Pedobacter gandavensis TaxID=2679963 RepID=A0ABR6EYN4_9SPHI|nr:PAS domain-containing protein [Pedobacter gandavensis]MBB2150398.1 PAS domain-containing protein [Pedobacter gandavensis]